MKSTLIGAVLCGALILEVSPLGAATFTPNVFDDPTPVAAPNGCNNGGRCSLREAVLAANATASADDIVLGEGTYELTIPEAGNPESGDLDIGNGSVGYITFKGAGSGLTTIKADAGLNERIIENTAADGSLTLIGITFQDGNSPGSGGAVYFNTGNSSGSNDPLTIQDCNFLNNKAGSDGGGVFSSGPAPLVNIDGGTYENNVANGSGGGLYLGGGNSSLATFVKNVVLSGNTATTNNGGGLFQSASNGVELENILATGNKAESNSGGGVYASNGGSLVAVKATNVVATDNRSGIGGGGAFFSGSGMVSIQSSVFSQNSTLLGSANGGGVYVSCGGDIEVSNSTADDNHITNSGNGGGFYLSNGSDLKVTGTTASNNSTADGAGGGIYHSGPGGNPGEITNSTISGNQAPLEGGGIFLNHAGTSLNNVTLADNSAGTDGGGVFNFTGGTVILRNSIFTGNSSSNSNDDCGGTTYDTQGFNIYGSSNDANCLPDGSPVGSNPDDIVGDPLIGALQDNGGPTFTRNLLDGSPAIDGGNPAGCKDGSGATLTVDQRGATRPAGAACDIGAVEAVVADLAIVKVSNSQTYIQGDEITYTLTVTNNGPDSSTALVEDALPSQVTFISAAANCANNGGTVTCDLGALAAGASASVEIIAEASGTGDVDNTATVSGSDVDTDSSNDSSTASAVILAPPPEDNGGCSLGSKGQGSPLAWSLFGIGLGGAVLLRRRRWE